MIRPLRSLSLLVAAIALLSVPVSAQDSVAGSWLVTVSSPDMGDIEMTFHLEQEGTEVTGTADLSAIPEVEGSQISEGLYEDRILSFLLSVSVQGQWFTVEVEADVDGDEMVGDTYMAEMGQSAPFTAKRIDS